jgi:hypothetical protein
MGGGGAERLPRTRREQAHARVHRDGQGDGAPAPLLLTVCVTCLAPYLDFDLWSVPAKKGRQTWFRSVRVNSAGGLVCSRRTRPQPIGVLCRSLAKRHGEHVRVQQCFRNETEYVLAQPSQHSSERASCRKGSEPYIHGSQPSQHGSAARSTAHGGAFWRRLGRSQLAHRRQHSGWRPFWMGTAERSVGAERPSQRLQGCSLDTGLPDKLPPRASRKPIKPLPPKVVELQVLSWPGTGLFVPHHKHWRPKVDSRNEMRGELPPTAQQLVSAGSRPGYSRTFSITAKK